MSYIETHGNTNLIAIKENEYPELWSEITNNGEAWDKYKNDMANGNSTVIAAEHNNKIYPLFSGGEGSWEFMPFFKVHGGQRKIALEAEIKDNKIYLLQECCVVEDPSLVVEVFKLETTQLSTSKGNSAWGTSHIDELKDNMLSPKAMVDAGQGSYVKEFQAKYSFFEKFGGNAETSTTNESQGTTIGYPTKFKVKNIDKITNFNPSTDTLEIDVDSFGIDSSATFASGKNKKEVKKKLAKQDFDFLYDQKKGGLYFNENGADKGFGDGGIIAILKGAPDLTSGNLEFI